MCCQFTQVSTHKSSHSYKLVALPPKQTALASGNNTPWAPVRLTSDEYFCETHGKLHTAASGPDPPTR